MIRYSPSNGVLIYTDIRNRGNFADHHHTMTALEEQLLTNDAESLVIPAIYLQSGFFYTFKVELECNGDYKCDTIEAIHDVIYDYSNIKCGILGGDIVLNSIDPVNMDLINWLTLNGLDLTYDPDGDESELQWSWDCVDTANNESCQGILKNVMMNNPLLILIYQI